MSFTEIQQKRETLKISFKHQLFYFFFSLFYLPAIPWDNVCLHSSADVDVGWVWKINGVEKC